VENNVRHTHPPMTQTQINVGPQRKREKSYLAYDSRCCIL
jgi:hypothetical protein